MFFLLYILMMTAGLLVMTSKNTVQSVLYLILVFLLCSLLFIYLGADFMGLIMLMVYMGAIAVLFLFVVMMLNMRLLENAFNFTMYMPMMLFLSLMFIFQIIYFFLNIFNMNEVNMLVYYFDWNFYNNMQMSSMGELLFNSLYMAFMSAAMLLFISMVGAIVLTMDEIILPNSDIDFMKKNEKKVNNRFFSLNINWKYMK